ncbi:MAG: MFS transporter, partial [Acidobacteria bacterium]|nr:MFS transporter [Acidobacteriota bacterium]
MRHDYHYVESITALTGAAIGKMIPIDRLRPNPNQPRKDLGDLRDLTHSIREKGVLEPLLVRYDADDDMYTIISGERRFHAARAVAVAATAFLLVLVLMDAVEPWHVFIASFFLGWLFVLEFPSRRSLIYDLVGSERIVSAMSLETINSTLGKFIGPFTAGLLIELTGFSGTYVFLIAVYAVSFVLILVMRGRGPVRTPSPYAFWSTVSRGFKYSVNNSVIRS